MSNEMRDAAISYAARGWPVLPCNTEKKPLILHGLLNASLDPELIKRWWLIWPDANIGIRTGDGLAVVDIDQEDTPEGCDLPPTLTVKTGRGHHYYYSTPQKIQGGAHINMPHVDLRGEGGYVIAPPSVHANGHVYTWLSDSDMVLAPDWVLSRNFSRGRVDTHQVTDQEEDDWSWRPAAKGERDQRAISFAARQVKTGQTNQRELANVILAWNRTNEPPMGTLVDDPEAKEWAMAKAFQALQLVAGNGGERLVPTSVSKLRTMNVERSWIVEGGVLTEHSKTIIYGETGTGKTFLGMQLAHAISSGTPFLGKFNVPVPKKVLYLSGENAIDDLKVRILNFDKEFHYSDDVLLHHTFDLDLSQAENMNVLRACIKEYDIDVVIIDPLYVFARVDEAKLLDVIGVEIAINRMIVDLNVSVVLIHHPTKGSFNMRGDSFDRGINELRGAGWAMWAEAVIKMSGVEDKQRTLVFQKVRSAKSGEIFQLEWSENQVFTVDDELTGDDWILAYIEEQNATTMAEIRRASKDIEGCTTISRNLQRLRKQKKIKWNLKPAGPIALA